MAEPHVINIKTKTPNWVNTVVSTLSRRISSNLFGVSKNGKRDLNEIYGYKTTLSFDQMYWMWRRGGLAFRIVNSLARSCWRDQINVINDDKEVLVEELKILNKHGHLAKRLEQADILNRIGRFSILFVGIPDGLDPATPLGTARGNRLDEVFFRAYAEDGIIIKKWDTDPASPRCGLPEEYTLQIENRGDKDLEAISKAVCVHWSRVVHLAEGSLDSDVEGISALEPIFNTLEDIVKTSGGSAEAYFRNARNRFSMQTDPKYAATFTPAEKLQLEEEAQAFQNDWQDFIRAGGIDIKALNVPHHSPIDTFITLLKIVAGTTGIPIRILTGEGAGQLAGNEDKESYNQLVQDRRDLWCTEWAERVLMILTEAKMLELKLNDEIIWGTPDIVSAKDKSTTASANATALNAMAAALSSVALDGVIDVKDAMELIFGEQVVARMDFDESGGDGLTDEELADAEIGTVDGEKPLDPTDPAAAAAVGGEEIQKEALNGAQIKSLLEIVQAVAEATMPIESAFEAIKLSFPTLDETSITKMLMAADAFEAPKKKPLVMIPGQQAVQPGEEDPDEVPKEGGA